MKHAIVTNIPDNPKEILEYAKSKSFKFWVDEKGTEKHPSAWQRRPSDLSFDEAFDIIQNNSPHWVFTFRNISAIAPKEIDFWDFGGCNIGSNDYGEVFIWIQVTVEDAKEIFERFNLQIKEY